LTWGPVFIIFPYCMHSNKPKIGISLSETKETASPRWPSRMRFDWLRRDYYEAITMAGGVPILLPNAENVADVEPLFELLDGLMITGGGDMHPSYFGQEPHPKLGETTAARDNLELAVFRYLYKRGKPILGICRGHQVINVALGGTLHQDLSCLHHATLQHTDSDQSGMVFHDVTLTPNSLLSRIAGATSIETNSSHHQVVDKLGQELTAVGFAPDGILEAYEHPEYSFLVGVQWHPERITDREHSSMLFKYFVEKARK
jgi:putative glutamine amidotransferase